MKEKKYVEKICGGFLPESREDCEKALKENKKRVFLSTKRYLF